MGLLGNIRYVLTQSHYEWTTLRVCAFIYSTVCVYVCIYDEKRVWVACLFFLVLDNIYFCLLYVYIQDATNYHFMIVDI